MHECPGRARGCTEGACSVSFPSVSCLTLPDQQKLRLRSPVLKKQACPQWKHSFVFSGVSRSQLRQSSLELTVWDQAIFGMSDRLLGGARLGSSKSAGFLVGPDRLPVLLMSLARVFPGYHEERKCFPEGSD